LPTCHRCESSNPDAAHFCNQCGARIETDPATPPAQRIYTPRHLAERVLRTRAAMVGERKRVTVLFVDIKGSTRLAEQAGAEAWHGILDRYFNLLGTAVHRYEGTLNQFTGDGIMALFGAPLALEDHAQRACLAALEIQREVRRYADQLRLSTGLNLSMRAGLNTGEVIVGAIGDDLRMDYTAQGLTVNLAARMEQICEPGRIYLTRNTAALAEGYFQLRDLGRMAVAGLDAPLPVYELEAEGPARTRLERRLARGAAAFVGRDTEQQVLHQAFEAAAGGLGGIAVVVGEAGIGKSRLCHELAQDCERRGYAVHRASGVPYATAMPFHPVQSLVRQRLGLPEGGDPAALKRSAAGALLLFDESAVALLPRLLDFLGESDPQSGAGAAQTSDRRALFEMLARLIAQTDTPQLLLVEDLHFADPGTEAFLQLLAAQVAGRPTLLLLNFRPDYRPGWLQTLPHRRIDISALDTAQVEMLARQLLGSHASVSALPQALGARAGGNPFYVEEAVQALAESGDLQGSPGHYALLRPIERWSIPDTVHALVAARVDRLAEHHKQQLQSAAIIGLEFGLETWRELAALPQQVFASGLALLQARGFIEARSPADDGYAFCHPLTQDVVYRTQLETQRSAVHRRLAGLLEARHPRQAPPDEQAAAIAHHWRRAGEWRLAAEWNLRAARWAANQGANAALGQLRLALRNLERVPPDAASDHLRIQAYAGLVRQAPFTDISNDEVEDAFRRAQALAEANNDTAAKAELLISYSAEQLHRGDAAAAVATCARAMQQALDSGAGELIGRFRLQLLLAHSTAGYPREGIERVSAAGGDGWLTEPISEDNYRSRGLHALMLGWLGQLDAAREQLRAALDYAERQGQTQSWMHVNWIDLASFSGEHDGLIRHGQRALQLAEASGSSYFRAIALRGLGLAQVLQGDPDNAVALLEQALPLVAPGANAHQFQAQTLATLSHAYRRAGDPDRARQTAEAAIASAHRAHARVWEIMAWLAYLELPDTASPPGRSGEGLERVDALIESTGAAVARPFWWLAKARLAGDPAASAAYRAQARQGFERVGALAQLARHGL
jgi:adenylate cyclase